MYQYFRWKGVIVMSKILSVISAKVTSTAINKENAASFLWGHRPRSPKVLKK